MRDFRHGPINPYHFKTADEKKPLKQIAKRLFLLVFHGGLAGIRTRDQRIKSPLLYRLSYQPVKEYNYAPIGLLCQDYCVNNFTESVFFLPQIT